MTRRRGVRHGEGAIGVIRTKSAAVTAPRTATFTHMPARDLRTAGHLCELSGNAAWHGWAIQGGCS
jgi:hypothetical protein